MLWWKCANDLPANWKLRQVARECEQPVHVVLAVWTTLLCHASSQEGEARGTLAGWMDAKGAVLLDLPSSTVRAVRMAMADLLLSGDAIADWGRHQDVTASAVRMRRLRERRRSDAEAETSVTQPTVTERHSDATVTRSDAPLRPVTREERRGEYSEPIGSGAGGALAVGPSEPPPDARTVLFREGLDRVRRLTGKPPKAARSLLGRWLREAGDDCALLAAVLHQAEAARPLDPVPWVTAALGAQMGTRAPPGRDDAHSRRTAIFQDMLRDQGMTPSDLGFKP
jgi:hypothetical protein